MAIAEAGNPPEKARRRRRLRAGLVTPSLLGVPVVWLLLFFVVPIGIVAAYSVNLYSLNPGPHELTTAAWHDFIHTCVYRRLFWKLARMRPTVRESSLLRE